MFQVTGGVDTHKGLIFFRHPVRRPGLCGVRDKVDTCTVSGSGDLPTARPLCAGGFSLYTSTSSDGRNSGLYCMRSVGCPGRQRRASPPPKLSDAPPSDAGWTWVYPSIMPQRALSWPYWPAQTTPKCSIVGGGKQKAGRQTVIQVTPENLIEVLTRLDIEYNHENLNPGGCADSLAVSILLLFWERDQLVQ